MSFDFYFKLLRDQCLYHIYAAYDHVEDSAKLSEIFSDYLLCNFDHSFFQISTKLYQWSDICISCDVHIPGIKYYGYFNMKLRVFP
jgi:hypothetical protein